MSRIFVYTSPARGHIYPLIPILAESVRRGHDVIVRTLSDELDAVRKAGVHAKAIDARVEAREIDDWKATSPPRALLAACRTFADRAIVEIEEVRQAIGDHQPDLLFVDVNSWGAQAVAEASGRPWATFAPYFMPMQAPGVPPWGLGLAPMTGLPGRIRD